MPSVIIIDDDKDTVFALSELMEIDGYEVVGKGYNGKDAYDLYKEKKPDFVLIDLIMPEFDGYYGIKMIKKEFPNANIIVISVVRDKKIEETSTLRTLKKPYRVEHLEAVISSMLIVNQKLIT